jgi:transposase
MTIVAQTEEGRTTVEYVGEGREQATLDAFWEGLMAEQLEGVEAVAMDMWKPYVQSTVAHVPDFRLIPIFGDTVVVAVSAT